MSVEFFDSFAISDEDSYTVTHVGSARSARVSGSAPNTFDDGVFFAGFESAMSAMYDDEDRVEYLNEAVLANPHISVRLSEYCIAHAWTSYGIKPAYVDDDPSILHCSHCNNTVFRAIWSSEGGIVTVTCVKCGAIQNFDPVGDLDDDGSLSADIVGFVTDPDEDEVE